MVLFENLKSMETHLKPFWNSSTLTIKDIGMAAQLWGLFAVPEFQFSPKVLDYLMQVKSLTNFNYTNFHWRNS